PSTRTGPARTACQPTSMRPTGWSNSETLHTGQDAAGVTAASDQTRSASARCGHFGPLNGADPRATNCAAISWGAWYTAGRRGESQPIEPDPGHAGGGRDASAAKRTQRHIGTACHRGGYPGTSAPTQAAGALHHQCGG